MGRNEQSGYDEGVGVPADAVPQELQQIFQDKGAQAAMLEAATNLAKSMTTCSILGEVLAPVKVKLAGVTEEGACSCCPSFLLAKLPNN